MPKLLSARRQYVDSRLVDLRGQLKQAAALVTAKGCVYVTGSFARGEASQHSDLDLFIVGDAADGQRRLSGLDEILVKADLIEATRRLGFPEFSGDGEYLFHHTLEALVKTLGRPEDDASNTFTARLLLLLESRPLLEETVYKKFIEGVVTAYWRDYADHKNDFMPAFLANDILRLWRTFCVNYEARTKTQPDEKKAKRKLKNYKLKHSRLLTCYSALIYLLAKWTTTHTVSPLDAMTMAELTPTSRLEWLPTVAGLEGTGEGVGKILEYYERFLADTDQPEEALVRRFLDKKESSDLFKRANTLGDLTYQLIETIGKGNAFHRLLMV
jgi:predicted nucleotidyltransferase